MPVERKDNCSNQGKGLDLEASKISNPTHERSSRIDIPNYTRASSTFSGYAPANNTGDLTQQYQSQCYHSSSSQVKGCNCKDHNDRGYGNVERPDSTKRAHPYNHLRCEDASLADVLGRDY